MKATNTSIALAKIMGQEAKAAGLTSVCQNSDFLHMLNHFAMSYTELMAAYVSGYKN